MSKPARVLIVAGSDSSGGAGIQADIRTVTVLGGYAMTAITAVTVQDTSGVHGFHTVPPDVVGDQIRVVLGDIGADAVKIGMLVSATTVEAVARAMAAFPAIPLVLDTVMIAKGGTTLLDDTGVEAMKTLLFPRATLITPNAPEAARLTGIRVDSPDEMMHAARKLRDETGRAILVKGGHVGGDMVMDALADATGEHLFRTRRIANPSTHGTGCTLASAIATGLAQGLALHEAVARGRSFVQEAIRSGLAFGRGTGPVNQLDAIHLHNSNPSTE